MNYFDFYGIKAAFYIDAPKLKKLYYARSRTFHPDFHTSEDNAKQEEMLKLSGLNNEAYKALSDFHSRMHHILSLYGNIDTEVNVVLPSVFLLEMMDINEQIMESQAANDRQALKNLSDLVRDMGNQMLKEIEPMMISFDALEEKLTVPEEIKEYYLKHKYLLRIKDNLSKFAGS